MLGRVLGRQNRVLGIAMYHVEGGTLLAQD